MSISSDRNPQIGNLPGSLNIPEDLDDLHFDQFGISPEDLDHGMHICKGCPDGNDRYAEIVHLEE